MESYIFFPFQQDIIPYGLSVTRLLLQFIFAVARLRKRR